MARKSAKKQPVEQTQPEVPVARPRRGWRQRLADFRARRPHRSFRRTRRRDSYRSLKLPGYWVLTFEVGTTLWRHRTLFALLVVVYVVLGVVFGTLTSQTTYTSMRSTVQSLGSETLGKQVNAVLQAGAVAVSTFVGESGLTSVQKVYLVLALLFTWLTTVWLLREINAGRRPKLRDGLYNAGAPIIPTVLVMLWAVVQLLPLAVVVVIYNGLISAGFAATSFGMYLLAVFALLVACLVVYWMTTTFLASVIVTLPGMYPWRALQAAGDIVIGRRLRILYRLLWLFGVVAVIWLALVIPIVLFDTWLSHLWGWLESVPWVPLVVSMISGLLLVYICSYIYLLYRKVVADDANPA